MWRKTPSRESGESPTDLKRDAMAPLDIRDEDSGEWAALPARKKQMENPQMQVRSEECSSRMPVIFAAHGAPVLLNGPVWMSELADWGGDAAAGSHLGRAAHDARCHGAFPIAGWWMDGAFTKRSVQFD